jgi:uncharacterized phage-associated protein
MAMVSAHDVAREVRERDPEAGSLKIHKLLYYCQGWHLALNGEPLFAEDIEAWANGPVVADLWHDTDKGRAGPPPSPLDARQRATVAFVCGKYRQHRGRHLIAATHGEPPWREASGPAGGGDAEPNPVISLASLRAYFATRVDPAARALLDALPGHVVLREQQVEALAALAAGPPSADPETWFDEELSRLQ